uniref:Nose resistant-to-fluoxetine protein N-terminal domain-containing protein n=1 Tax=Tetranychus urticae TaxID=32264 RepID=T1K2Y2_TETUR
MKSTNILSLSGSQPNNFLDGNYAAFGSYDTCLSFSAFYDNKDDRTSDQNAKGQYCLTSFEPDLSINGQILGQLYPHYFDSKYNFTIKVGFCVPSVCSQNDVQQIITQGIPRQKLVDVHSCDVKTNFLERLMSASQVQQILFWLLVGLVCIVVLGTCIDAKNQAQEKSSLFWIQQFSAIKSVKSLFHKTDPESRIPVLDGIRLWVLSSVLTIHAVMWHTIINASFLMEDYEYLKELPSKIYSQPFIDDWIVEGLFFLGGVNAATTLFRKMKPETPVSEYLKSIFRRAALLVPILLPAMAIEVILPLFGSGPIYQSINQYRANICCASSTWSLAVEWQLFALACILVYIYKRNYRLGLTLNILTVIFGLYRVIMIFLNNNLIVNIFVITKGFRDTMHRAEHYYISTEARICYYFCGILMVVILAGNYEAKIKQMFPNDKIWVYALLLFTLLSSSLWNCFGMKIGTITTRDPQFSTPNKDTIAILNNNSELLDKTEINRNHSSKIRKVDPLEFIVRVTRPAFFVHSVVYAWYFTSLRSSIPSNLFGYVIQIVSLITLTIFFGFFFHILVIGPVERINYISSKRKIKAKTHSS